jgi:hypothetical protein
LFGQDTVVGDSPIQDYSSKIGTPAALGFKPKGRRGKNPTEKRAAHAQQLEVDGNSENTICVIAGLGTNGDQFQKAFEMVSTDPIGSDAGKFANLCGQLMAAGFLDERVTVGNKELQQH